MKKKQFDMENFKEVLAEQLRSGKPLTGSEGVFTSLMKEVLEKAMEAELDDHLSKTRKPAGNRRNGHIGKTVKSSLGAFDLATPRDRNSTFDPQIIGKRQVFISDDIAEKVLGLYGLGMSYADIRKHLEELYGVDISQGQLTEITDRILPMIQQWQSRPLDRQYAVIWLDAMHFKSRENGQVQTNAVYSVLAVTMEGRKEVIGIYIGAHESTTFWMQILSDLKQRGVEDILICCIDNLKGFADAVESMYPQTDVQLCIVHQMRNSFKYMSFKDQREFSRDLKLVYHAATVNQAWMLLEQAEQKWGKRYPMVFKSWKANWERLMAFMKYPEEIRRIIYTNNTVESYHRMVRKVTKTKGIYTNEKAILKQVFLATQNIEAKWNGSVYKWTYIRRQLVIYFGNRVENDTV
jgi:putative transposase